MSKQREDSQNYAWMTKFHCNVYYTEKKIIMTAITQCSTYIWLGSHKPHGRKQLLPLTHFLLALCYCKLALCSTSTLPHLPILNHCRWCPVGVALQYMAVVQVRSALKLLQPAHSWVFRWFAFSNQHSSPIWTAFISFYHFPWCVSPALFNMWLPNTV